MGLQVSRKPAHTPKGVHDRRQVQEPRWPYRIEIEAVSLNPYALDVSPCVMNCMIYAIHFIIAQNTQMVAENGQREQSSGANF